jgi:hypothetical protein
MASNTPFITPIKDPTQYGPFASPLSNPMLNPTSVFMSSQMSSQVQTKAGTTPTKTKPVDQEKNATIAKLSSTNTPLIQTTNPFKFSMQNTWYWPLAQNDLFTQNLQQKIDDLKSGKWPKPAVMPKEQIASYNMQPSAPTIPTQPAQQPQQDKSWMQENVVDPYFDWKNKRIEENPTYQAADQSIKLTTAELSTKLRQKYPDLYWSIQSDDNVVWLYAKNEPAKFAAVKDKYYKQDIDQMNEVTKLDPLRLITNNFFDQNAQDLEKKKEEWNRTPWDTVKWTLNSTAWMVVQWWQKTISWLWNTLTRSIISSFWWDTKKFDEQVWTNYQKDIADIAWWVWNVAIWVTALPITAAFNAAAATPYLDNVPKAISWVFTKATQGTREIGKLLFGNDNQLEQHYSNLDPKRQAEMDNLLGALIVHRVSSVKVKNKAWSVSAVTALKDLANPVKMLNSIKETALNIWEPWSWTQPGTVWELVYNMGVDWVKSTYNAVKGSYEAKWAKDLPNWDTPLKTSTFGKKETTNDLAWQIFQSKDEVNNAKAAQGLKELNTKKVSTYKDIVDQSETRAWDISKEQDAYLWQSTKTFTPEELSKTTKVWDQTVSQNHFEDALNDLKDLYTKQNNKAETTRIEQTIQKMNSKWLSLNEQNAIAREYGIKEKAYSYKSWAPLTSSSAEGRETIRVAMKDTLRNNAEVAWLDKNASKSIDKRYSNIMETKRLAKDMSEKVQNLRNTIKSRWFWYKVVKWLLKVWDILSLWSLRWVRDWFITSNEWNKVNNSLDIQENLKTNLKKMDTLLTKLERVKSKAEAETLVKEFTKEVEQEKAQAPKPEAPKKDVQNTPKKATKESPFWTMKKKTQTVDTKTPWDTTKTQTIDQNANKSTTGKQRYEQQKLFQRDVEPQKTISQDQAKTIVNKYFKDSEISTVFRDKITTPEWQNAFGAYHNGMIEFAKDPKATTPEHEVVHAYIDLFKTHEQKKSIIDYALDKHSKEVDGVMEKFGITDKYEAAEEFIADGFIEYVKGKSTLSWSIKAFFKSLWNDVKGVFGKWNKVQSLYNDISTNARPVRNPFDNVVKKRVFSSDERFSNTDSKNNVSVKFLDDITSQIKKDDIGKTFIENYANRPELKAAEKRIIKTVLDSVPWDKISKQEFVDKVKWELLDLSYKESDTCADYNYLRNSDWDNGDNAFYDIDSAKTHIYEAPFSTKWLGHHFRSESNNYFAHARIEDIGDIHRVTEIQSDLFQRRRYLEHDYVKKLDSMKSEAQANYDKSIDGEKFANVVSDVLKDMNQKKSLEDVRDKIIDKIHSKMPDLGRDEIGKKIDATMYMSNTAWETVGDMATEFNNKKTEIVDIIKKNKEKVDEWNKKTTDDLERDSYDIQRLKVWVDSTKNIIEDAKKADPKDVIKMVDEHKKLDEQITKLNESKPKWADTWNMDKETKAKYDSIQEQVRELWQKQDAITKNMANLWVRLWDDMDVWNIRSLIDKKIAYNQNQLSIDEKMYARAIEQSEIAIANSKNKSNWLNDYANIFHERILREEIKVAAQNGQEYVQIPMPKTIAMVEGYISNGEQLSRDVNVWEQIESRGQDYIITNTDWYGSEAMAVNRDYLDETMSVDQWMSNEIDSIMEDVKNDESVSKGIFEQAWGKRAPKFNEWLMNIKNDIVDWKIEADDALVKDMEEYDGSYSPDSELIMQNEDVREQFIDEFWYDYTEDYIRNDKMGDYFRYHGKDAEYIADYMREELGMSNVSYNNSDWSILYFERPIDQISEPIPYWNWKSSDDPDRKDNLQDEQKAVVDFYDKKIIPYAKKLRKDATVVEQDGGEWLQIPVKPEDAEKPVMAYQRDKKQSPFSNIKLNKNVQK